MAGVALLATAYHIAGVASLALQYEGPVAALWLGSGFGAAVLYRGGLRWWPALVIGDVTLMDTSQPLATALTITAGNMADMFAIALVLRSLCGPEATLGRLEHVGGMLVASLTGATITATVAALAVSAGGVVAGADLPGFWRSWFLADACGSLVVIPLALAWARRPGRPARTPWEGLLMVLTVAGLSAVSLSAEFPLTYIVFPALIWAALRLGPRGATIAVAVTATVTVAIGAAEHGAFVEQPIGSRTVMTQVYIAVAALTTLVLAALDSERRRAQREVAASRVRNAAAAAQERRRVEGELHDSAQSRLVAMLIRITLLREHIPREWHSVLATVDELTREAEELGDELRRVARRISPPLLAGGGLVSALAVECADRPIRVRIAAGDVRPSTVEAELAVYLCCLEAIEHAAAQGGPDTSVTVRIEHDGGALMFSLHHECAGTDAWAADAAVTGLRDRLESVGGRLEIATVPGRRSSLIGVVPWPARGAPSPTATSDPSNARIIPTG